MIHPYLLAIGPFSIYISNLLLNMKRLTDSGTDLALDGATALHQLLVYIGFCFAIYAYVENSKSLALALAITGFTLEVLGFWYSILKMHDFAQKDKERHALYVFVRAVLFGLILTCAILSAINEYENALSLWYAVAFQFLNFIGGVKFGAVDWYFSSNLNESEESFNQALSENKSASNDTNATAFNSSLRQRKQNVQYVPADMTASFYL